MNNQSRNTGEDDLGFPIFNAYVPSMAAQIAELRQRVKTAERLLKRAKPMLNRCCCAGSDGWRKICTIIEAINAHLSTPAPSVTGRTDIERIDHIIKWSSTWTSREKIDEAIDAEKGQQ